MLHGQDALYRWWGLNGGMALSLFRWHYIKHQSIAVSAKAMNHVPEPQGPLSQAGASLGAAISIEAYPIQGSVSFCSCFCFLLLELN